MRFFLFIFSSFLLVTIDIANATGYKGDLFLPGSSWLVGSSSIIAEGSHDTAKLPCVMMNQYNNGYVVRFSGGGNRIMAMAINFKQDAFKSGQYYNISLSVPNAGFDKIVRAKAFDRQTLLFSTQEYDSLYSAISAGKFLNLGVGKRNMSFALLGMKDGLSRMENCYRGQENSIAIPANAIEEDDLLTPMPGGEEKVSSIDNALRLASKEINKTQNTQVKPKVIKVSNKAPVKFEQNISENSDSKASGRKLARTWGSPFKEEVQQKDVLVNVYDIEPASGEHDNAQKPVSNYNKIQRWRAIGGSNLRDMLENWSRNANTRLIWTAGYDFPVKNSIIVQGSFEEAVLQVLEQYNQTGVRPVGRIYNDPEAGQRVLLIERIGG
jgi:hypothetical protein